MEEEFTEKGPEEGRRVETGSRRLSDETLMAMTEHPCVEELDHDRLRRSVLEEPGLATYAPDGFCRIDPRNGERIVYNSARSRRPHDNRPTDPAPGGTSTGSHRPCVVCEGRTTRAIDVKPLSEGMTFLNKNLFPILFPAEGGASCTDPTVGEAGPEGIPVQGFHFLQWTSTLHQRDWHDMPLPDCCVAMERLAALEERLLLTAPEAVASNVVWGDERPTRGFVGLIKNFGRLVGGSLEHGHQQIAWSDVMPRRFLDNLLFERRHGRKYSEYLLDRNPRNLELRDYGRAVLLVPYFMRRPYDMQLVLKDAGKRYLHQLDRDEIEQVAAGWRDAIRALRQVMPELGRELAFNVVTMNGPGAGLYFEFLPWTQEIGGYEQLGLFLCQALPDGVADRLREILDGNRTSG